MYIYRDVYVYIYIYIYIYMEINVNDTCKILHIEGTILVHYNCSRSNDY